MATSAEAPHPVHPVGGFIRVLPAYSLPNVAHILYWTYKDLAPLCPCSLVEKGSLGSGLAQGTLCIARVLGAELLPAAPLQPCAEASSGRRHVVLLLDWVNLAPGHYASPPCPPCSAGMRHPLGVATCAEAPHPVHPVGGFIRALAAYSLLNLAQILCSVSLFASNDINWFVLKKFFNENATKKSTLKAIDKQK